MLVQRVLMPESAVNAEIRRLREENRELRERLTCSLSELRATDIHSQASHTKTPARTRSEGSPTIGPCS